MYIGEWVQNLIHELEIGVGRRVSADHHVDPGGDGAGGMV